MTPALPAPSRLPPGRPGSRGLANRRPLLVAAWAGLLGQGGLAGQEARRRLGRFLLRSLPSAVAMGVALLVALGSFAAPALGWPHAAAGALLVAALAGTGWRRARRAAAGRPPAAREQVELGALAVLLAFAVAQTSGGPDPGGDPPLFPAVYLALAFLVALLPRAVGLSLAGFAVAVDAAAWSGRGRSAAELPQLVAHAAFILLFAALYHAVLAARVAASRRAEGAAVARRLREIEERAREYRLLSPGEGEGSEPDGELRLAEASVVEIEAGVRAVLEVAEVALRAHTAALYILSADERELRLRECRSRSERVERGPIPAGEGALGGVVRRRAAVRLCGAVRSASWYDDGLRPAALLAVPVLDRRGGHLRGVLLADRLERVPFSDEDERLLRTLAAECLRAVEAERLLADMKRTRDEKERFYQAIERLNRTVVPGEVLEAALEVVAGMVPLDFGAVALREVEGGMVRHRVVRCRPPAAEGGAGRLEGLAFPDGPGLVAQAVRLGASLPARDLRPDAAVVFDEGTRVRGLAALKVVPLRTGGEAIGALVVGSRRRGALGADAVRRIEVIAMQAADALVRARLFEQTERLATTDGLTGLLNHRTFQDRLEERLAEARRYGKRLSLLLADIDHFKAVNDTYGHPCGDRVLAGVGRILAREARAADLVARHGGEEFAIAMPETDAAGARVIAERIRERVAAEVFDSELGPLRVTLSLGLATFPGDARARAALLEAADACLYAAKRGGRNRTVSAPARSATIPAPGPRGASP